MATRNSGGWNEVTEESQVKFDQDGDEFTGILISRDVQGTIPQAHFEGTGKFKGDDYFTNMGRDLERKMEKVPVGAEVLITRTGTLDTGHRSGTAMVTFAVKYRAA